MIDTAAKIGGGRLMDVAMYMEHCGTSFWPREAGGPTAPRALPAYDPFEAYDEITFAKMGATDRGCLVEYDILSPTEVKRRLLARRKRQ